MFGIDTISVIPIWLFLIDRQVGLLLFFLVLFFLYLMVVASQNLINSNKPIKWDLKGRQKLLLVLCVPSAWTSASIGNLCSAGFFFVHKKSDVFHFSFCSWFYNFTLKWSSVLYLCSVSFFTSQVNNFFFFFFIQNKMPDTQLERTKKDIFGFF